MAQSKDKSESNPLDLGNIDTILEGFTDSLHKQFALNEKNKLEGIARVKAAYQKSSIELSKKVSPSFLEGQNKARNLKATYDNPHHPTTEKFSEYSKGWTAETNSQNEKKLATSTNVNLSIKKRQKAFDLLQNRSTFDNTTGKAHFSTNEGRVELGKRPESKEVVNSIEPTLTKEAIFEKRNKVAAKDISANKNKATEITPEEIKKNLGVKGLSKEAKKYNEDREKADAEWDKRVSVQARRQSLPKSRTNEVIKKNQIFDPNYIQEVPIERDKNVNSNDFTKTPLELNEEEKERRAMRLAKKFDIDKNKYRYKDASHGVSFTDDGKKIVAAVDNDDRSISGMVELAKVKGWDVIKVSGAKEFKQKAWLEAKLAGLEVKGYKPNEKDLKTLSHKENSLSKGYKDSKGEQEQETNAPVSSPGKNASPVNENKNKNKVFEGTLIEHGVAEFKGNGKGNKQSYFAIVRTAGGDKKVWGKELANVIGNSGNKVGDEVKLEFTGKKRGSNGTTYNGWKINNSKEVVAVKAVADAFVDKNIKNPSDREVAKQSLYENIDKKARSGSLPDVKIYDKSAERQVKSESTRSVDVEAERTR